MSGQLKFISRIDEKKILKNTLCRDLKVRGEY
jgi:hypothetical protein